MLCQGGMIVAADTQMTWDDASTYDAKKVRTAVTSAGSYAIAYSCPDARAADSLVAKLIADLKAKDPKSLVGVESIAKSTMSQWVSDFTFREDRPFMQLVLGTFIQHNPADGLALYFCEPPNTVTRQTLEDSDSKGYIAIGQGHTVTDPLFRTLFGKLASPHVCLAQLSYLMYRAKKDCRGACGGHTDAVFLKAEHSEPLEVERRDMAQAESLGQWMDAALARTASAIIPEAYLSNKEFFDLASDIHTKGLGYKNSLQFRSRTGEEIV